MKKLLLAFEDFDFTKDFFNLIALKFSEEIIVSGITNNIKETTSHFLKYFPDIICTDADTYINICDKISSFEPIYFIIDNKKLLNIPKNTSNMNISDSFKDLVYQFKSIFSNSVTRKLELKLYKQFHDLNFNFKLSGTRYLFEAILFVYEHNNLYALDNMKKNIYPEVSNKYHTNPNKVKWNIEKSISYMYEFNKNNFPRINWRILKLWIWPKT